MEIFNNTTKVVRDDLAKIIKSDSKIAIAAACFSIYAYQELRQQLQACKEFRFLFTSPVFVAEKTTGILYFPFAQRKKLVWHGI